VQVPASANESEAPRLPRRTVYLESRYRKLQRGLPQTIFWCPVCKGDRRRRKGCSKCAGFGKLTRESVQELVGRRALPAFQAKTGSFHGAGREDVDVLMLGRGRPFVYEVTGARHPDVDLEALRQDIVARAEGAIELAPFAVVGRERVVYWKETHFDKIYRAEVVLGTEPAPERLAALAAFAGTIVQRTPQRVAHRRADRDRRRAVRVLAARLLAPLQLELRIQCQHGTYVKEWVSGDETRTSPSLATLLAVSSQCALLDVEEILTDDVPGERLPAPDAGPAELQERKA
jgi:tRNA pseudouridine synthase 10